MARVAVPLVLLALIWSLADAEDALGRLRGVEWSWVVAAFVALNLQTVLSALRWTWVSDALGAPLAARWAIAEYYLAQLINQTVPGGVVGDASRAVRAREQGGLSLSAQAVVIERLAGQMMLWSALALGVGISVLTPGGIAWPLGQTRTLAVAGAIVVAVGVGLWLWGERVGFLKRFGAAMGQALTARAVRLRQATIGVAIVLCNLFSFAFAARATGTMLSIEAVFTLVPLILTAMLIPATIAGWGYREGAAAALFPLAGASTGGGLAASLLFGLLMLTASLPGVFVLMRRKYERPKKVRV